jgi:hypothetical protein
VTLVCSFLPVSCKIAITIFDTITIRYPTTSDCFYHNVLLSMPYHVEMLLPKRSSLHFFVSISSIQILHTNSNQLQTKSRSFIDYNDQSNNPKCTVYLYDSFLHMSCDFLSIIDVIVLFSHKTLIRCHFNFSIVEFNCDGYSTFCAYLTSVFVLLN